MCVRARVRQTHVRHNYSRLTNHTTPSGPPSHHLQTTRNPSSLNRTSLTGGSTDSPSEREVDRRPLQSHPSRSLPSPDRGVIESWVTETRKDLHDGGRRGMRWGSRVPVLSPRTSGDPPRRGGREDGEGARLPSRTCQTRAYVDVSGSGLIAPRTDLRTVKEKIKVRSKGSRTLKTGTKKETGEESRRRRIFSSEFGMENKRGRKFIYFNPGCVPETGSGGTGPHS